MESTVGPNVLGRLPSQLATRHTLKAGRRRALISLTPLIDVVFILLVFFMLASSLLEWRAIDLNAPGRAGANTSMEGALLIEIRTDGLRLSGQTATLNDLKQAVLKRLADDPDQRILIKPAAGVPLQDAVSLLDHLADIGARDLSFIRDGER